MTDFVTFAPEAHGSSAGRVSIRSARPDDAEGLAVVMASRGGVPDDHIEVAARHIERSPVLLLAQAADGSLVGWSGVQMHALQPDLEKVWLVSGLTVLPEWRRRGVGRELLARVIAAVDEIEPGSAVHSVINARNLASIALHEQAGFREIGRGPTFAGITFTGGVGVLLAAKAPRSTADAS